MEYLTRPKNLVGRLTIRIAASISLMNVNTQHHESGTYVCIELLGQLEIETEIERGQVIAHSLYLCVKTQATWNAKRR